MDEPGQSDLKGEGGEEEDLESELNEEEEFEVEEKEEEEEEEEEEEKVVKKRRCQRRKKVRGVCFENEDADEEEEEGELGLYYEEEDEEDEGEKEEESDAVSSGSSVLSSISFVWENQVYEFEELCDPGNIKTIYQSLRPKPDFYDELGVYRYLEVCSSLNITPTIYLLKAFRKKEIDLSYRNPNRNTIRAMCAALETNSIVERLILKHNRLTTEDCNYIGAVMYYNETLSHLDFTGCRVGPEGLELLIACLPKNESVVDLILSSCNIQNEGMKLLGYVLMRNNSIRTLDLSYNKLGAEAAEALGMAFKVNSCVQNLNLRYNNLFDPVAAKGFFRSLASNDSITRLDLSWNGLSGPDIGGYIGNLMKKNRSLKYLNLSDNRFEGAAVIEIKKGLSRSRSLEILKIGKNPMSPEDLELLLSGAKGASALTVLDLEDLWVKKTFIKSLKKLQQDRDIQVNFAGIFSNYEVKGPDYPKVILQRAQFEAMKPKSVKKRKDFGHLIWTLGEEPLTHDEFMARVKRFKAKINKELFPELIKQFTIPKVQLIDVVAMKQKYLSIFPESMPPPPPKAKNKKGETEAEGEGKEKKEEENIQKTLNKKVTDVVAEGYDKRVRAEGEDEESELVLVEEDESGIQVEFEEVEGSYVVIEAEVVVNEEDVNENKTEED